MNVPKKSEFARLITKAREGDAKARQALFALVGDADSLGADLLRAARRLMPPGDRARGVLESQDLLQTALRAGWVDVSDFQGATREEFLAWLRVILKRKLLKAVRRKRPSPGLEGKSRIDATGALAGNEESPLTVLLREETRVEIRAAIAELPADQQAVVKLRLQGLDSPRIAAALGIRPEAVRKRESRAAKQLRERLGSG